MFWRAGCSSKTFFVGLCVTFFCKIRYLKSSFNCNFFQFLTLRYYKAKQKAKIRIQCTPIQWIQVHNTVLAMPKSLHEQKQWRKYTSKMGALLQIIISSDPDLDTDPDPGFWWSKPGFRTRIRIRIRAECFSCSLGVLYGGLRTGKL